MSDSEFIKFIANFGIVEMALATAFGLAINTLIKEINSALLIPVLEKFFDFSYLKYNGIDIGRIITAFIEFTALTSVILFFTYYVLGYFLDRVIEHKQKMPKKELELEKEQTNLLHKIHSRVAPLHTQYSLLA